MRPFLSVVAFINCCSIVIATFNAVPLNTSIPVQDVYDVYLSVSQRLTMADFADPGAPTVLIYNTSDRNFYFRVNDETKPCDTTQKLTLSQDSDPETFIVADGQYKLVTVVNGILPGSTIIVRENATVRVHVTNNNPHNDVITVHFHGMTQQNTFWYDGAGTITQCPIRSRETFTYEFKAQPVGTYWYHAHVGPHRGDGFYGALIVLPHDPAVPYSNNEAKVPDLQYVLQLGDWYPYTANQEFTYSLWNLMAYYPSFTNMSKCYSETRALDGSKVGETVYHSLLINGKGWYNQDELATQPWQLPLQVFRVQEGKTTLLRLINTAVTYPHIFSIDEHQLMVAATDGSYIKPVLADYVVVHPGERYDVWVIPKPTKTCQQCYIKSQTTEYYDSDPSNTVLHYTLAFLSYDEKPIAPQSPPNMKYSARCSQSSPCIMVNCPFPFPSSYYIKCVHTDELRSWTTPAAHTPELQADYTSMSEDFQELYINCRDDSGLNGVAFLYPKGPPALFPGEENIALLSCDADSSECTNYISVKMGAVVQLTLYNRYGSMPASGSALDIDGYAHPMHIHGYHFYVVKMGRGGYNDTSGLLDSLNQDIDCGTDNNCNNKTWSNSSWSMGRVSGTELQEPVSKDTIAVPIGGYAVLRFKADNPGWWILHCHILPHQLNGMAILIRVGEPADLPPVPQGFPQCLRYSTMSVPSTQSQSPSPKPTGASTTISGSITLLLISILTCF